MRSRWFYIFLAIAVLVLAQIGWWTTVLVQDVDTIASLKRELAITHPGLSEAEIKKEAFHRRLMFLSESITFGLVTLLGLFLLYRALKAEQHSRTIQRNFVETVTHESKTPLTALKLRLEAIQETWKSDLALSTEVELALVQVRRLASILEKALNLNRMERHAFHFEVISLGDVVRAVVKQMEPLMREKNVELSTNIEQDCWVKGDLYALQNSLQSLVENAILYNTSERKQVWISARASGNRAILSVKDNGPGIAERDQAQIFDRFYRGKGPVSVPGTGLGLYLAKSIVEAHQGLVKLVESGSDGLGSRFEIQLPPAKGAI